MKIKKILLSIVASVALTMSAFGQVDTVNVGTSPNAGDGDNLRSAFLKVNANDLFLEDRTQELDDSLIAALDTIRIIYNDSIPALRADIGSGGGGSSDSSWVEATVDTLNVDYIIRFDDQDGGVSNIRSEEEEFLFDVNADGSTDFRITSSSVSATGQLVANGFRIGSATIDEAELEVIDGATLTTTELNYVDGVTSSIQDQLDAKLNESDTVGITYGYGLDTSWTASNAMTIFVDSTDIASISHMLTDTSGVFVFMGGTGADGDTVYFDAGDRGFGMFHHETDILKTIVRLNYISSGDSCAFNIYYGTYPDTKTDSLFNGPEAIGSNQIGYLTADDDEIPSNQDVWMEMSGDQIPGSKPVELYIQLSKAAIIRD